MKVLFIDDERRRMEPYVEELQMSGVDVVFESDTDKARKLCEAIDSDVALVILDVMMPHRGSFSAADSEDGLRTGVLLYKALRSANPELPIMMFTNISSRSVPLEFAGDTRCRFVRKMDFMPHELAAEIQRMVET